MIIYRKSFMRMIVIIIIYETSNPKTDHSKYSDSD